VTPWRTELWVGRSGMPGIIAQHRLGPVQRLDPGTSHPHRAPPPARAGGSRYNPTTSRTFSTNSGSSDSVKVRFRSGAG